MGNAVKSHFLVFPCVSCLGNISLLVRGESINLAPDTKIFGVKSDKKKEIYVEVCKKLNSWANIVWTNTRKCNCSNKL